MKTILIADDDHYVLNFLQEMMLGCGYRVIAKQDGRSALAVVSQGEAVDLVITDYQMPGMDGLELVERLKQTAPSVPVVMVSASPRVDIYLKAMALGVVEFVEKPAKPQVIRRVVEQALARPASSGPGLKGDFTGGAEEDSAAHESLPGESIMKLNCWEVKRCGREPGGAKAMDLGVCTVTTDPSLNSAHGGKNAGRACWVVAGTLCGGKVQGTYAKKLHNCWRCEFMNMVKKEEAEELFGFSATRLGMEHTLEKLPAK